jgi:hypothetical protein
MLYHRTAGKLRCEHDGRQGPDSARTCRAFAPVSFTFKVTFEPRFEARVLSEANSRLDRLPVAHRRGPGMETWICGTVHSPDLDAVPGSGHAHFEDSLDIVDGRFAALVLEHEERRVRLIADPCASVPLYYLRRGHETFVSNDPSALRAYSSGAVDTRCIPWSFHNYYPIDDRTLLADMRVVRPGATVTITSTDTVCSTYYAPEKEEHEGFRDAADFLAEFDRSLMAIGRRCQRLLVGLSGGAD